MLAVFDTHPGGFALRSGADAKVRGASSGRCFSDITHFQKTAQGHFNRTQLEMAYGKDIVRAEYERLTQEH